jgi:hypothetical protein
MPWHDYTATGTRTIVVAGVIQTKDQLDRFATAVGAAPCLVRLVVRLDEVKRRLSQRHGEFDDAGLRWHLDRAPELDEILSNGALSMTLVENNGPPLATAHAVLAAIKWPLVTPG